MSDPHQNDITGPSDEPPIVMAAAESVLLDGAFGLVQECWPDVEGNWEEEEFHLPPEEYLRLVGLRELPRSMGDAHLQLFPSKSVVTVVALNRPGLLSLVAGTLALHRLGVRSAAVASGEGALAVAVIELESDAQHPADWERVHSDLRTVLQGQMCLDTKLGEMIAVSTAARLPVTAVPVADTRILIDNIASRTSTMVEVRAVNSIGLLYRITKAIADRGLDVSTARVSTIGDQVLDCFYLTDAAGAKISDPTILRGLERAIRKELHHAPQT